MIKLPLLLVSLLSIIFIMCDRNDCESLWRKRKKVCFNDERPQINIYNNASPSCKTENERECVPPSSTVCLPGTISIDSAPEGLHPPTETQPQPSQLPQIQQPPPFTPVPIEPLGPLPNPILPPVEDHGSTSINEMVVDWLDTLSTGNEAESEGNTLTILTENPFIEENNTGTDSIDLQDNLFTTGEINTLEDQEDVAQTSGDTQIESSSGITEATNPLTDESIGADCIVIEEPTLEEAEKQIQGPHEEEDPLQQIQDPLEENPPLLGGGSQGAADPSPPIVTRGFTPGVPTSPMTGTEMINKITSMNPSHEPDAISWISKDLWDSAKWDGIPIDKDTASPQEICDFLMPHFWITRGIRELFYELNPFEDVTKPTPSELDEWHIQVIRHIRRILGFDTPVENDARLYLEAQWATQRKFTKMWDEKYPEGVTYEGEEYFGWSPGPCFKPPGAVTSTDPTIGPGKPIDSAKGHCGASFFPDSTDREKYISSSPYNSNFEAYPELENYNQRVSKAEGVKWQKVPGINWVLLFPKIVAGWICGEHFSGHAGPYIGRTKFGCAWYLPDGSDMVFYRGKFA